MTYGRSIVVAARESNLSERGRVFFLFLAVIVGLLFSVFSLWIGYLLQKRISFLHDPVYVPSTEKSVHTMLKLAKLQAGQTAIDFGSGDGRIVIALAQKGIHAIGYEINPLLVWQSRGEIARLHLEHVAEIHLSSFWNADVSQANAVFLYTTASIMTRLRDKLFAEMPTKAKVISQEFVLPKWKVKEKVDNVYLYVR
jgi:hypothetical protein